MRKQTLHSLLQLLKLQQSLQIILNPSKSLTKNFNQNIGQNWSKAFKVITALSICMFITNIGMAQDLDSGVAAINEAATGIEPYFEAIRTIVFIIAGIIALLGAVRVYMKWNMGDPDVMSSAAAWFGSAIFLIVSVTVIQNFFNIG